MFQINPYSLSLPWCPTYSRPHSRPQSRPRSPTHSHSHFHTHTLTTPHSLTYKLFPSPLSPLSPLPWYPEGGLGSTGWARREWQEARRCSLPATAPSEHTYTWNKGGGGRETGEGGEGGEGCSCRGPGRSYHSYILCRASPSPLPDPPSLPPHPQYVFLSPHPLSSFPLLFPSFTPSFFFTLSVFPFSFFLNLFHSLLFFSTHIISSVFLPPVSPFLIISLLFRLFSFLLSFPFHLLLNLSVLLASVASLLRLFFPRYLLCFLSLIYFFLSFPFSSPFFLPSALPASVASSLRLSFPHFTSSLLYLASLSLLSLLTSCLLSSLPPSLTTDLRNFLTHSRTHAITHSFTRPFLEHPLSFFFFHSNILTLSLYLFFFSWLFFLPITCHQKVTRAPSPCHPPQPFPSHPLITWASPSVPSTPPSSSHHLLIRGRPSVAQVKESSPGSRSQRSPRSGLITGLNNISIAGLVELSTCVTEERQLAVGSQGKEEPLKSAQDGAWASFLFFVVAYVLSGTKLWLCAFHVTCWTDSCHERPVQFLLHHNTSTFDFFFSCRIRSDKKRST